MRLLVQPASTQTLLTNESGERSVVGHAANQPAAPDVVAVAAAPAEPARPGRDDAPRMMKVATNVSRPAPAAHAPARTPVAARAAAPARHVAMRPVLARQSVQRARPVAARAPAAAALRATVRKAVPSVRAERREVGRPAVKVASDRRGGKV